MPDYQRRVTGARVSDRSSDAASDPQTRTAELAALSPYVPEWLLSRALVNPGVLRPEAGVRMQAAVAFADIAGFTTLAERLAATGREGAEELTALLNRLYTTLLDAAAAQGGSVARFGGDAMTVLFPAGGTPGHPAHRDDSITLAPALLRAIRGALAMQQAFAAVATQRTSAGESQLTLEIGISAGSLLAGVIGRPEIGLEFVLAGRTLDRAAAAERNATPGTIHLDSDLAPLVAGHVRLGSGITSYPVLAATHLDPLRRTTLAYRVTPDWADLPDGESGALLEALRPFLPLGVGDPRHWASGAGEHRRITTAFVGFSGLDYDQDPNPLRKLQAYFTTVQEAVAPFGGRVNRVLTGDKGSVLHLLFGAPVAHEDDAARALRAALAVQHHTALPFPVEQCIGVATGPVFAGALGSPARREYTVLGATVNLAARLTEAAAPGQILLDSATTERAAAPFRLRPQPARKIRGLADPIPVWSLEGEEQPEADAVLRYFSGEDQVRLVGRDDEVRRIEAIMEETRSGKGQVLLITGEAGIGKSRLTEDLISRWMLSGGVAFAGAAPDYGARRLYQPWIELLCAFCDLRPGLTPEQQRARLRSRVRDLAPLLADEVELLAQLLGLAPPGAGEEPGRSAAAGDFPPPPDGATDEDQIRSQRRSELILELLRAAARRQPVLLLIDGLQWADPASLALVDLVARETLNLPLLLCLEARDGTQLPLAALHGSNAHTVALGELPLPARAELLAELAARKGRTLAPALARLIAERSQGNPFFIEELLAALDSDETPGNDSPAWNHPAPADGDHAPAATRRGGNGWNARAGRGSGPPAPAATPLPVPDTIEGVLMARLDRLPDPARLVVRRAAVLGGTVPLPVLRGLVSEEMSDEGLQRSLDELVRDDLLRPEPGSTEPTYHFKHTLIQHVAYESLAYAQRRRLHGQAGATLERLHRGSGGDYDDALAYHYGLSDCHQEGRAYLEKAGDRAAALFALPPAVQYYQQALAPGRWPELDAADTAPDEALIAHYLNLRRKLSRTQLRSSDYAGAEATLRAALAICPPAAWEERAVLYCELAAMYETWGDYIRGLTACQEAEAVLQGHPPERLHAVLGVRMGSILFRLDDSAGALRALNTAVPVLVKLAAHAELALAYTILGHISLMHADLTEARIQYERGLILRQQENDLWGMANAYNNLGNVCWAAGQFAAAHDYYEQSLALREHMGDPGGAAMVYTGLATVNLQTGNLAEAARCADLAITLAEGVGRIESTVLAYCWKAELLDLEGDLAGALALYERAQPLAEETHSAHYTGRAGLGLALIQLRMGHLAAAQAVLDAWAPAINNDVELLAIWLIASAEMALAVSDLESAEALLTQAATAGERYGALYLWERAERMRGELSLRQHDPAQAAAHATLARTLAEQMPARIELALALDLLACCYEADAGLAGAMPPGALLAQAVEILESCGPTRHLAPVRRHLDRLAPPGTADGIAPAEEDVLEY
jgi:class 3 adenylate cyclase/tetratricopeptide (TPR) repeat protein